VEVLGLQPGAKPWIVNLGLVAPEFGIQSTLNLEMIEFQLDDGNISREIAPNIHGTHVESGEPATLALCFYHHMRLLFDMR
jgi:hypothetical protein